MKNNWTQSNIENATYLGLIELENGDSFQVMETPRRLVFGGSCNAGFLESGFIVKLADESTDETLAEVLADLNVYYSDGAKYVSRIICNERM